MPVSPAVSDIWRSETSRLISHQGLKGGWFLALVLIVTACSGEAAPTSGAAVPPVREGTLADGALATPGTPDPPRTTLTATSTPAHPSSTSDTSPTPTARVFSTRGEVFGSPRRTPFVPLDNPQFLKAEAATYLPEDDLVLGLEWQGEARAYPIRMLRYHHIVNDTVGGQPLLVTY